METALSGDSSVQMELFPILKGGRLPRRRGPNRKKIVVGMFKQLDIFEAILATPDDEVVPLWTVEEIMRLHAFLLDNTLQVLADTRTSLNTVSELLEWVCAWPETREQFAFSFRLCCLVVGYDETRLREGLIYEAKRLHRIAA